MAIDGRILQVARSGFLTGTLLVPQAVVGELRGLADSADEGRRARGRRGLDVLAKLRDDLPLEVIRDDPAGVSEVDAKTRPDLSSPQGRADHPGPASADAAGLAGVNVLNPHAPAKAMAAPVTSGDEVESALGEVRQGARTGHRSSSGRHDGDRATRRPSDRGHRQSSLTSVTTTSHGRLVFARLAQA